MKPWELSSRRLAFVLVGWLAATGALMLLVHITDFWLLKPPLFLCIAFLPGVALLRMMRIAFRTLTTGILYSFGLSILTLMVSGLIANQLLPLFGLVHPLSFAGVAGAWVVVTGGLIAACVFLNRQPLRIQPQPRNKHAALTRWFVGLSALLPILATLGAFRLNNGGDALLAELTLVCAAALMISVILLRKRLPDEFMAWFIFMVGLTILLMTSLRGWDIVGHDIEREFRVYTLTHSLGRWDISADRDPYNACLSITILPEMFAKILNISGLVVFKLVLQVIFALCPVVLYTILRQYISRLGALVGGLLFLCYPTFINDSAMLTRQGIAYLFFTLAILIISNKAQKNRYKFLFLLCGLGVVLSHYSTAYMFVALFGIAVCCKLFVSWREHRKRRFLELDKQQTVLSLICVGVLLFMTIVWYVQITGTSGGLVTTVSKSVSSIPKLFSDDNKSTDTSGALLFAGGKTQADLYQSYVVGTQPGDTNNAVGSALQYAPVLTSDDIPITPLGEQARAIGISSSFISALRQNFAKFLQLLALIGVLFVTFQFMRKRPGALGADFICLNIAGIVLLALMVILPVLSVNYGVLRAFQQALIFLILPIMMLAAYVVRRIPGWLKTTLATLCIVSLFLLFTGFFAQILGGTSPTLSMANQGLYYGLYYSSDADAQAFLWMKQHIPKGSDVRAANFNRAFMHDPNYPFARSGVLPFQVEPKTFTYLDPAQVLSKKLYTYYQSSPLILTFPIDYYETIRNQIYSTTSTRIYR